MLMKLLEEYKVTNTVGEPVGRIKEAFIDLDKWEIVAFEVSPGALKKNVLIDLKDMERLDLEGKKLVPGQKNGLEIVDDRNTKEFQMTYHRKRILLDARSQPRQDHISPKGSSHMIYPQGLIIHPHK